MKDFRRDYNVPTKPNCCQTGLAIGILTLIAVVVLILHFTSSASQVMLR